MPNKIIGVLEQREGKLKKSAFEVLTVVNKLSADLGLDSEAVVIGGEIQELESTAAYGITNLIHYKNAELANYSSSAYSKIITDYAEEASAEYLVFADTAMGKDLAPRVSIRLNGSCIVDCVSLSVESGSLTATRPVYAGKALLDLKSKSTKTVITIRPNVFKPVPADGAGSVNISVKNVEAPDLRTRVIELKKSEGKLDVAEADIIVSGGRGLKGPENFYLIENLAEILGAATGASRAAVDAGWRPHREQVGQTGKTVSPSLYIACGISGAIQHLAGMSSSKYIVAINKDKDAPIFSVSDYGIAGDLFEVLPALTEEIKKLK